MRGFLKVCEDVTVTFEIAWLQLLPDLNSQVDWFSSGFIFTMEKQLRKHPRQKKKEQAQGGRQLKSVLQKMREGALKCHRLKVMRYSGYA